MMRWIIIIIASLTPILPAIAGEINLRIGENDIRALVANTPKSRETGLMQTNYLCQNCGMLFVFSRADQYSFWMKNTPLPLSIAFITAEGNIINIEEMQAFSTQTHRASKQVIYALEMNKGWFDEHSIKPLHNVYGLDLAPKGQ